MNKKLIATAVAGALLAPAAMAASHANVTPYLRINNALDITDSDDPARTDDTDVDIRNVSSRIGLRASADVGNGTTVFGQYEFSTDTDKEGSGIGDTRVAIVGLRGSFGAVSVGNQWSAFYNTVGTHIDPTYTLGAYIYATEGGGVYRQSNSVKYANSFGAVAVEVDTRFAGFVDQGANVEAIGGDNGEDFLDGFGVGVSVGVTDAITLAAAYDSELFAVGDDVDRLGVAAKASLGAFWVSLGYMNVDRGATDVDVFSIYGGTSVGEHGNVYAGYLQANDVGGNRDPDQFILHADWKIGGGPLRIWYEGTVADADTNAGPYDFNSHLFGLRIDM